MKLSGLLFLSLWALPLWAQVTPRQIALEQFPSKVRELVGKPWLEARRFASSVAENKRREDNRGLMLNLLGVNYDVTLGKKNEAVDWIALRSSPQYAKGLYGKLMEKHAKGAKVKDVQVGGPAPGQYVEVSFPAEGVQFRFMASSKDLYSVVVQRK